MAGSRSPVVNITITGDATPVTKAFGKVEDAAEDMAKEVTKQGSALGDGIQGMTDKADESERKFRGLGDTINGTSDVMAGFKDGNVVGVAMGLADLAGGITDFVGPALKTMAEKLGLVTVATEGETVAQEANNVAMAANPIGLVVIALVALAAAFYIAWTKSETFRDVVTGVFDAVLGAVQTAFNWIKDNWPLLLEILLGPFGLAIVQILKHRDDIIGWFKEVPDKLREALNTVQAVLTAPFTLAKVAIEGIRDGIVTVFGGIGDVAARVFKAPINAVIDAINKVQFHVHLDTGIPGVPGINFDWNGLNLPKLGGGGWVKARPGGVLALLGEAGEDELVIPLRQVGPMGGTTIVNMPPGVRPADAFTALARYNRRNAVAS